MKDDKYLALFQPMKIGGMEVKNRIVLVAMGLHSKRMVNPDNSYTQDGIDYFAERAKGGVGLIITGAMQVQDKFDQVEEGNTIAKAGPDFITQMNKLTDAVHQYGAKMVIQLSAGSGRTSPVWMVTGEPIAPSDGLPNVWKPEIKHRALTIDEIQMYVRGFADGAVKAKESGFDGVEIHAMHEGYLLDQFTMECTNQRNDQYGGSLENRLRILIEIVDAIKERCGKDYPVMLRYSVRSMMKGFNQGALPGEDFKEFGRDLEESKKAAKILEAAGYDCLDADNGTYDSWFWPHPPVYMPEACNLADCVAIKKEVSIPVICAGKMGDPDIAAKAVTNGDIDAIGLARPLLADPQWPNKVMNSQFEDIRPCISCHVGCLDAIFHGKDMSCALNPACGRELAYELKPADKTKKVMVIGAGIAGMEVARVSKLCGHDVEVYEKTGALGGVFIPASSMSFKSADKKLIEWYSHQMQELKIPIHFNMEVTAETVTAKKPDVVYLATGSHPRTLNIPGGDSEKVVSAIDGLMDKKPIGNKVAIIGGGLTGVEIAYELALKNKQVDIIEMLPNILQSNGGVCAANENMLRTVIDYYHIGVHAGATLTEINDTGVEFEIDGQKHTLDADTVIVSIGYNSNKSILEAIRDCGAEVKVIGDAEQVSNLQGAVWNAFESAMSI